MNAQKLFYVLGCAVLAIVLVLLVVNHVEIQ